MTEKLALCKFQKFVPRRIDRRLIKNAPYNPRVISKDAERRLKKKLATRGLLQSVTWNEKTGNCVGGHQRLAILDALMKTSAYLLDVDVVQLTPKQEREENIAFNNPALQGDWDIAALADAVPGLDLEQLGFDQVAFEVMLGEKAEGLFAVETQPAEVQDAVEDMAAMVEVREAEAAAARQRRQDIRKATAAEHEAEDTERIGYVLFPTRKAREDWVESLGMPRDTRYVPAEKVRVGCAAAAGNTRSTRW